MTTALPKIGGVGIFAPQLRWGPSGEIPEAAKEVEELGYTALWFGDAAPGPIFDDAATLLGATDHITVGTGILNLWMHDVESVIGGQRDLAKRFPHRFLLGIGVSHGPLVDKVKPGLFGKPIAAMTEYLDKLDAGGVPAGERALAALGPRMLELARQRSSGALPFLVTPEQTGAARAILGPDALLAVEQGVLVETDPTNARTRARARLATYLTLPNYRNNILRHGFTEEDLEGGGSDRLVDGLVVWGTEEAIATRVSEHRAAGADHVSIQVLTEDFDNLPREEWRRLAPALTAP